MIYDTVAFNYYEGFVFSISVTNNLEILNKEQAGQYYKIVCLKSGTYHFILNGKEFLITGCYALCLNEQDVMEFCELPDEELKILVFKPIVVSINLSMDVINNPEGVLSPTEFQDIYYLMQFKHSAELNMKLLPLRTVDFNLMEHKLKLLSELLSQQDNSYWVCRCRSYLFEILFSLARQQENEEPVSSIQFYNGFSRLAVDVIYYLQSSYNQKITIEKLSEEFHTNRTTLLTDFKKYTGQSVNRYLTQLRINMASTLLRETELPVDEICERTGFNDISYFSKAFKKNLSYTPSEYRKIYK
jgi:AraC family L-rhamnose operon regulatory protein RhaS